MNELMNHITKEATLSSLEVAKMIEKQHKNLLSDIRGYVEELNELKIEPVNFFQYDHADLRCAKAGFWGVL